MSERNVAIEPWAAYPIEGGAPSWVVVFASKGREMRLSWSSKLGRFSKSWDAMHLRRSDPGAYREAVGLMRDFCSKIEQQPRNAIGTLNDQRGTLRDKSGTTLVWDTSSRARRYPSGLFPSVPCPKDGTGQSGTGQESGTLVVVGQGQASTPFRTRPSPTDTTVADRKQEHKDRFAADPRFSAWVAMGPA